MNEFFEKIDKKFKELLDHPIPALLLKENDDLFKELTLIFEPGKALLILQNFLLSQGYKILSKNNTEFIIECSIDDKIQYFSPILSNSISFNLDLIPKSEVNFFVIINPSLKRLIFISDKKLDKTETKIIEFSEEYAQQNFKIIRFK